MPDPVDQGRGDQARDHPVADAVGLPDDLVQVGAAQGDVEPAAFQHLGQTANASRRLSPGVQQLACHVKDPVHHGVGGVASQGKAFGIRGNHAAELELRIEALPQPFGHQQHLEQQRQVGGQAQLVAPHQRQDVDDQPGQRQVRQRHPAEPPDQGLQPDAQGFSVDTGRVPDQVEHRPGGPVQVPTQEGNEQGDQVLAKGVVELAHHAEVDHRQTAVGCDEEVARVRVGMEEAVLEDHLAQHPGGPRRKLPAVDAGHVEGRHVVDLQAVDAFEGQDPGGRRLPEHRRELHAGVVGEAGGEPLGVVGLREVVQLGEQRRGEVVRDADHVVAAGHL